MEDTVRSLLRFVARGFYDKAVVLIIDALIIHLVLSEEDLVYLLGMKPKEVRAQCYRLVEDRIILSHYQREESQSRVFNRVYYYIRVTTAIDAIKWKVHFLVHTMKEEMTQYGNPQGYVCPRCGKRVSQLDAISLLLDDRTHFECDNCGGTLTEDDTSQQAYIRQARLEKLMVQVDPVIAYLKRIDDMTIQDNSFEAALTKAVPALSAANGTLGAYAIARGRKAGTVAAAAQKSQATLHVSISANDENLQKEQEEREERQKKLEQNALPSWHAASTVEKASEETETPEPAVAPESTTASPAEPVVDEVKVDTSELKEREAQDALAAYYAQLAEDDDDDDDDDDLEDI